MSRSETIKISIIVPTYNEEENIEKFLLNTHGVLKENNITHEIIVVDDIGYDNTRAIVKKLIKEIKEIRLIEKNTDTGLAAAMKDGYNSARGEYLGAMDADLCHDPKYLIEMIKIIDGNEADFVIGSRYLKTSEYIGKPLLNKIVSRVGNFLVRNLFFLPYKDMSNNFRVFKREIWENIKEKIKSKGNTIFLEIIWLAHLKKFRIKEIPTKYIERQFGKSKLKITKEAFRFLKNIIRMRIESIKN